MLREDRNLHTLSLAGILGARLATYIHSTASNVRSDPPHLSVRLAVSILLTRQMITLGSSLACPVSCARVTDRCDSAARKHMTCAENAAGILRAYANHCEGVARKHRDHGSRGLLTPSPPRFSECV